MLKVLAISLGLFIVALRGFGVLSPGKTREFATWFANNVPIVRGTGVFLLVIAILVFVALGKGINGPEIFMLVLAGLFFLGGAFLTLLPTIYAPMVKWFLKFSDSTIRFISAIGLAFGLFIIFIGFRYY